MMVCLSLVRFATIADVDREERKARSGALSPPAAFAVLVLLVVVLAGGAYLLTRSDGDTTPPASAPQAAPSPTDHQLTDAEAIARLASLDRARIQALEKRDADILRTVVAPGSPAAARLEKSIRTLLRDDVRLEHQRYEVLRSSVLRNDEVQIRIKQAVIVDVQFRNVNGESITEGSGVERQVLIATLRPFRGEWRFFDGELVNAEPIPQ